ncbi:MAG: ABC transporter ATP-binding protein [Trebonia sp.]|jgi:branched-chain amino acid transport system ATP-binding protein
MLTMSSVTAGYGQTTVLREVDFSVAEGEVVALLGPNGAGKTTLLRTATGFIKPKAGRVKVGDRDMAGARPYAFSRAGVCHIPEGRGIFPSLSVYDNLRIQAGNRDIDSVIDEVTGFFPGLAGRMRQTAGSLSGGEQQMVALSRAFLTHPQVVLVDEPSLGLAPIIVDKIYEVLARLASTGLSVVVVEQYVQRALDLAQTVYILNHGQIVHRGGANQIDPGEIYERYLGIGS